MYAMQYQIALPADYDMQIIRDRVRNTGHRMDGFPGLEFKAFLIQEKANGAPHNVYAPFYLWRDIDGMREFCWGEPGYSAIVHDFGRHAIQDWTVHQSIDGPAADAQARSLTLSTVPLPANVTPSAGVAATTRDFLAKTADSTVAQATAVDVTTWNVILAELSTQEAKQSLNDVRAYEVLHISRGA